MSYVLYPYVLNSVGGLYGYKLVETISSIRTDASKTHSWFLNQLGIDSKGKGIGQAQKLYQAALVCRYAIWNGLAGQLEKGWTLVDVGANWGQFSKSA